MKRGAGPIAVLLAVFGTILVAGCSGGQSDLEKWIAESKKKPGGHIEALPEVKPYETFTYNANGMRSPF